MPTKLELGGMSGGPFIGLFETESFVSYYALSGIVTEQPGCGDDESSFSIERVIASRADCITDSGYIRF